MTIEFIKQVLNNKLESLNKFRISAIDTGDLDMISKIDSEILEVQMTLSKLEDD